jgi:pimeloyl-ACP methyl ester carboxylesterase
MKYVLPNGVRQHRASVNGVELDVVSAGPTSGPVVVLAHGFPESSWSWRHQMLPLAEAGWHVLAPDQRGYGGSSRPTEVTAYGTDQLSADLLELVDQVAGPSAQAVFVGHDWGALLVWDLARMFPERCRAAVAVSVPFANWPAPPTAIFKHLHGDNFFYILYFQPVGPAETELGRDARLTMRRILWSASGDVPESTIMTQREPRPAATTGFTDVMLEPPNGVLPSWCTPNDLDVYTETFEESGFFGPVSWYRNLDANYERTRVIDPSVMSMPTWFIGGSRDPVIRDRTVLDSMGTVLPNFQETFMIEGAGHWTQQENPAEFNRHLLSILGQL